MNKSIFFRMILLALTLTALLSNLAVPTSAQRFSEWSGPENLGSVINTASSDGCPFISKDNRELYFASNRTGGLGANDVYASVREDETSPWTAPVHLGINSSADDFCPTLAQDAHYLFFVSARAGGCGGNDIWVVRRKDKEDVLGWGEPENLGCQVNSAASDITPSIFEGEDGTVYLYFSSTRIGGQGGMDIYVSALQRDGTFGPATAVTELNTPYNDARPNIRYRDGLEIFFESDRPDTLGSTDIYSSTRESTSSTWLTPQNLGILVNSPSLEGRPSLSFDGNDLYFMSGRPGGFGSNDIYVTHRSRLRGKPIE